MADISNVIYKLKTNGTERDAAYEKAVAKGKYTNDPAGRIAFLGHLYAPIPNIVPAAAPAGTPAVPQPSPEQLYIADLQQVDCERHASNTFGAKGAVLAAILAGTALFGSYIIPDIKGTEEHIAIRQGQYEDANWRYKQTHHGKNAPWYKNREELDEKVADERENGKKAVNGFGGLAAIVAAALGIAFIWRKK